MLTVTTATPKPLVSSLSAYSAKDKYHPLLQPHLGVLREMAKHGAIQGLTRDDLEVRDDWNEAMSIIEPHGPEAAGVYSFPMFSKEYCKSLLVEANEFNYEPNGEELELVQIPEVTLQDNSPDLFKCLHSLYNWVCQPLGVILLNCEPIHMASIQFAKYTPENTAEGHWHNDGSSDITLVIALSDTHEGGGTEVKPCGFGDSFEVPQLPVGYGMFFKGKTTLHQGMRVVSGERNLLVFWSNM